MQTLEFRAMNTEIVLAAEGEPDMLKRGFAQAQAFIYSAESRFSRFSETSELAALNRSAGAWVSVSDDLFDLVSDARAYFDQTRGLFDPTILDALELAGYDQSMDRLKTQGARAPRPAPNRLLHDFRAVAFDDTRHAIQLTPGMRLDLGGIAKGWIAESAALLLADYAEACAVNAGGDLFALGTPRGATDWEIELEDPRDPNITLTVIHIQSGAVATSSITKRRWQMGAQWQHHLIDPRHSAPAETDWLCVTALAPHAATAEVFAKALLIAGSAQAHALAAPRDDLVFIAVDRAGKLWGSPRAKEFVHVGL